jgi:capsular polysaccharide transport system permease protein
MAGPARPKRRHWGLLLSFLLLVGGPAAGVGYYLYTYAIDQYASNVGFSVRKEEIGTAVEILGGITNLSGSSSSDTDILYEFIQSQEIVTRIDAALDLRSIYSVPEYDPVFTFDPSGSTEDLVDYWNRMIRISYDAGTGLIELRVLAFDPESAQAIAQAIFEECSRMINELSRIAREDATRYASEELEQAVERLKAAREALTSFRSRTQIVDPSADVQGQVGLLNTLQQQLAEALIESDLLSETARENDPRLAQTERRIEVIRNRIAEERQKFGAGGQSQPGGEDYATLVEEFERLSVDREFAEQAYIAALSSYDGARAEAQRQSRYLAAYVQPTLPDEAQYPQRLMLLGLATMFAFLAWAILGLIYYSIRDRR